jgi:hypothetical protein
MLFKPKAAPPPVQHSTAAPPPRTVAADPKPAATIPQTAKPAPAPSTPAAALHTPSAPADRHGAATAPRAEPKVPTVSDAKRPAASKPLPALLKEPIPRVTAILISSDRKLATIDGGRIVRVGDVLGSRTVVAIDDHAITVREPSGVQIRVGLGGRVLGVERSAR